MAITFRPGGQPVETKKAVGRSIVLYGPPFSGKTSSLQYDPTLRYLMIDFDKNTSVIEHCGNVDIISVNSFEEYLSIKEGIRAGRMMLGGQEVIFDYDMYVIDSFTSFEEHIKQWVVETFAPKRSREIATKFGAQSDWQDLQKTEVDEVRDFQAMTRREVNPINVMWIGHDMLNPNMEDYQKQLQLRLQGKYAAAGIMSAVDACFYMIKVPNDAGELCFGIYTLDEGPIKADARLPIPERKEMPKVIWFPKWGEILATLGATK